MHGSDRREGWKSFRANTPQSQIDDRARRLRPQGWRSTSRSSSGCRRRCCPKPMLSTFPWSQSGKYERTMLSLDTGTVRTIDPVTSFASSGSTVTDSPCFASALAPAAGCLVLGRRGISDRNGFRKSPMKSPPAAVSKSSLRLCSGRRLGEQDTCSGQSSERDDHGRDGLESVDPHGEEALHWPGLVSAPKWHLERPGID